MSGKNFFASLAMDDDGEAEGEDEGTKVDVTSLYQISGRGSPQPLLREFCETMLPPKSSLKRPRPWKAATIRLLPPLPGRVVTPAEFDFTIEIAYEGRESDALSKHFQIHLHFKPRGKDLSKPGSLMVSQADNPGNVKLTVHDGPGGHEAFIKSRKACAKVLRRALKDLKGFPIPMSIPATFRLVSVNRDSFEDGSALNW
jgi:hypothetical protein